MEQVPTSIPTAAVVTVITALLSAIGTVFGLFVKQGADRLRDYGVEAEKRVRMAEEARDYARRQLELREQDLASTRALLDRLIDRAERTVAPAERPPLALRRPGRREEEDA